LKRLFAGLTFCCVAIGLSDLSAVIFWPSVVGQQAFTGDAIRVHGRFFDYFGRSCETCFIEIRKTGASRGPEVYQQRGTQVKRHWPGFYYLDLELPPGR
jgi:hypothetical protein